jgi:cytochrome c peroxidase
LLSLICVCFFALYPINKDEIGNNVIKKIALKNLEKLDEELDYFKKTLKSDEKVEIKNSFLKCRIQYKKVEFLIQYLQEQNIRFYNGANLPYVENGMRNSVVNQPEGLQVIEELVYEDKIDKKKVGKLITKLKLEIKKTKSLFEKLEMSNEDIFAAIRFNLIRIETLGISGFDVPICKNNISEIKTNIETIENTISKYGRQNSSISTFRKKCKSAIQFLETQNDIDQFDRLLFIKSYLQPITIAFFKVQKALDIPKPQNLLGYKIPITYTIDNIYNKDFINTNLYNEFQLEAADDKIRNLGKLLFFDPLLSKDNKLSCASCHQPEKGFTDALPKAITNHSGIFQQRNAPTLLNSAYQPNLFYDLRSTSLENQIEQVILNPHEFNTDIKSIIDKLYMSNTYINFFKAAFPEYEKDPISEFTILRALAAFVRSLSDFDSPFDNYMTGKSTTISKEINQGFNIFMGKGLCGTCHFAPTFYGNVPPFYRESETEVIGIPQDTTSNPKVIDSDLGRYNIRKADNLKNSFKTPTIRNISKTAPYMHNGIFSNLEEIIHFYQIGGGANMGMEVPNQTLPFDSLNLTAKEIKSLISFLKSLDGEKINIGEPLLPKIENHPEWNNRRGLGY